MNFKKYLLFGCLLLNNMQIFSKDISPEIAASSEDITPSSHFMACFFSHGLGGNGHQGSWYAGFEAVENGTIILPRLVPYELFSFHYFEVIDGSTRRISLGQENELELFNDAFNAMIESIKACGYKDENIHIILYGVSRGAAAILNWLATHPESLHYIAGVILESPFDSAERVFDYMLERAKAFKYVIPRALVRWFMTGITCGAYDEKGLQPIKSIEMIQRKDIPMLFIWSESDTIISPKSTENLFLGLRRSGHTSIRSLSCKVGSHGSILWGPEGEKYKAGVERFLASITKKIHSTKNSKRKSGK